MPAQLPFHLINAFAPRPQASGNQAAVVIVPASDARSTDDAWMRKTAADFQLSETAYLVPLDPEAEEPLYGLRWWTPEEEVALCGHATLASAYALFNYVHPSATRLRFQTRWRGELGASMVGERGQGSSVQLSLPVSPCEAVPEGWTEIASKAAGLAASDVLSARSFEFGRKALLLQLAQGVDIAKLNVNTAALMPTLDSAVLYTNILPESRGDTLAVNLRVFAPGLGVDEDPVTGSAWAVVAGYFLAGDGRPAVEAACGGDPAAKTIDARQVSKRGGAMSIQLKDGRALLTGQGWRYGFGTLEAFDA